MTSKQRNYLQERRNRKVSTQEVKSPSFFGLVEVVIRPEGRKHFSIFCKPDEVEEKRAKMLKTFAVKKSSYKIKTVIE